MWHATDRQADLRWRWHEWTDVIEAFARRRRGRRPSPEAYGRLHAELLAACRRLADAGGPRQGLYWRLLGLAQPWLGLAALNAADREVLMELWLHCHQAGKELGRPLDWWLRRGTRLVATTLLLSAAAGGAAWVVARHGRKVLFFLEDEYRPLIFAARRFGGASLWAGGTLLVVGLGVYLVMRITRA